MARRARPIVVGGVFFALVVFSSAAAGDFQADVEKIVTVARQLQSPAQALATLGDPVASHGAASPQLTFNARQFGVDNRNVEAEVTLSYFPPVRAPRRLDLIAIYYVPVATEAVVRQWLGAPGKIDDKGMRGRTFIYNGADRAGIGVSFVAWDGRHVIIFARGQ